MIYVYNSTASSWVWVFNKYSLSTLLHVIAYHFNFTSSSLGQNILTILILQVVTWHHFHILFRTSCMAINKMPFIVSIQNDFHIIDIEKRRNFAQILISRCSRLSCSPPNYTQVLTPGPGNGTSF